MIRRFPVKYLALVPMLALGIVGTAHAEQDNTTQIRVVEDKMAAKEDMGDPTRVICRKEKNTGSRLGSKRICATAAEWSAQKQQSRQAVERSQSQRITE